MKSLPFDASKTSVSPLSASCDVPTASELIRTRALNGLSVSDIAKSLNCSTRLLEMRFQEIVGRSVKSELLRIRNAC